MKNLTKTLLSILSIAILSLSITTKPSYATSANEVQLVATPLPVGTNVNLGMNTIPTTDELTSSNWSTTGTELKFGAYQLTFSNTDLQCIDGSGAANVESVRKSLSVLAADPDDPNDNNAAFAGFANVQSGLYAFTSGGAGGANNESDTGLFASQQTFEIPISPVAFNEGYISGSDNINLIGYVEHARDGALTYSVTSEPPVFAALLTCDVVGGSSSIGLDSPSTQTTTAPNSQTNSPKTGASEVLLGTFFVALLASSFVIYKAIEKHRKTAQISEK